MKEIITLLQQKKQEVIGELKEGKTKQQSLILQLDKAISWLNFADTHQLDSTKYYDIHSLPDTAHGTAYYHLMIDCESSDTKDWVEYALDHNSIEMSVGDIVIIRK